MRQERKIDRGREGESEFLHFIPTEKATPWTNLDTLTCKDMR